MLFLVHEMTRTTRHLLFVD